MIAFCAVRFALEVCAVVRDFHHFRIAALAIVLVTGVGSSASAQFETRGNFPVLKSPISIAVGDFNRDGKRDIAVVTSFNGGLAILLGNGDGTFKPAPLPPLRAGGRNMS